jgi:iron complex outermembrane receptor protein
MRAKGKALSLAAALAGQFCAMGLAMAQTGPDAKAATVAKPTQTEEIIVTGSRIRRSKELTTPAPVTVIGREQIQASSAVTIGSFVQMLPEQGGAQNTNVNNGGDGSTRVSLRGVGSARTLVLIDGKRVVYGGGGADVSVDLNTIPTAMVDRIEVLKDGASALYGSDAIGGVINIITRKSMDGASASAYYGTSQHGDGTVRDISAVAGARGEKGSVIFGAGYYDQASMMASDRSWANYALSYDYTTKAVGHSGSGTTPHTRVNGINPANCVTQSALMPDGKTFCQGLVDTFGAGSASWMYDPNHDAGTTNAAGAPILYYQGWRKRIGSYDVYNYQAVNFLVTPSQRMSVFASGEYRFSDMARLYFNSSYVNRQSSYMVAPEPFVALNAGIPISGGNPYNPFGIQLNDVRLRLLGLPGRSNAFDLDTIRVVGGIDGTLPDATGPLAGWFWDVAYNFGRTAGSTISTGWLNTQKMGPGIGPGYVDGAGAYHCGAPGDTIDGCTPVDVMHGAGGLTPAMAEQLGLYSGPNYGWNRLSEVQANVSGEMFKIASDRPVALAAGYAYREEYGGYRNEPILVAGWNVDTGSPGPVDTTGKFHVNEGYGELSIPLINQTPGIEDLEIDVAGRVFNYSTFGTDFTYKLGGRYSPVRDVTLRGTYSTAFRAPSIAELYQGATSGNYETAGDPCSDIAPGNTALIAACGLAANNGIGGSQQNSTTGGNAALKPEKANILTAGIVFEPSFVPNLALTFDYYSISMKSLIGSYGTQFILDKCYGRGVTREASYCDLVTRDTAGANPTYAITHVIDLNANVGTLDTSGLDFGGVYSLPTDFGFFVFRLDATYLLKYDSTTPDGTLIHGAGNYDGSGAVSSAGGNMNPKFKFNAGVNYTLEGFTAAVNARYISGFTECSGDLGYVDGSNTGPGFCYQKSGLNGGAGGVGKYQVLFPVHQVDNWVKFDLMLGYLLTSRFGSTNLQVGVNNVMDVKPPLVYNSFLTYADPIYDFVGRTFYARLEQSF